MNRNSVWVGGASLLAAVILAGGWFLGAAPQLAAANAAGVERDAVDLQNQQHEADLRSLKERFSTLSTLDADLASVRTALPAQADMPRFLRQINTAAEANGVVLNSFATSDDQGFSPAAAVAPVAPAGEEAATATTEPTADAAVTTEESAAGPATDLVPAAMAVPGGELVTGDNFVTIPVSLSVGGSYESLMGFVKALQTGDRLFLVTSLSINSGTAEEGFGVEIEGFAYALLDTEAAPGEPLAPVDASITTVN